MITTADLIHGANMLAEEMGEKAPLWRMKYARPLFARARLYLSTVCHRLHERETELAVLQREVRLHPDQLLSVRRSAEKVSNRILLALAEMDKFKDSRKSEKPFAIILSPYQLAQVRSGRLYLDHRWLTKSSRVEFCGLPVFSAKGLYGPLVVTEDGFNALSRNAPELLLKGA
jgi:hypothetical protein